MSQFLMFKKLGFETATYPPFCTMSWNILVFFDGVPKDNLSEEWSVERFMHSLVRMGTLVMIVHDCGDPLLELAKLLRYAKNTRASEAVLVVFTPVWVISRWNYSDTVFDLVLWLNQKTTVWDITGNGLNHCIVIFKFMINAAIYLIRVYF